MRGKSKKHSGFTLLELIIVMALFTIIMYSAVQLMQPVSKYFVRSSNYESSTACVDNMKRAIEGNLKYADRVRVYADYNPYDTTLPGAGSGNNSANYKPSPTLLSHVNKFYTDFFMNRQFIDNSGTIYVMVFDNTVHQTDLSSFQTISDFSAGYNNAGNIVLYEFNFPKNTTEMQMSEGMAYFNTASLIAKGDAIPTATPSYSVTPWYVNQKLYGNYEYQFELTDHAYTDTTAMTIETETGQQEVLFNPSECTVQIHAYEIQRLNKGANGLTVLSTPVNNSASFAMKNVLDSTRMYTSALRDRKPILKAGADLTSPSFDSLDVVEVNRYEALDLNSTNTNKFSTPNLAFRDGSGNLITSTSQLASVPGEDPGDTAKRFEATQAKSFYFIFTVPETTYSEDATNADFQKYLDAVNAKYPPAS